MYLIAALDGMETGIQSTLWVVLAIFVVMVILGWLASVKGWLNEEKPVAAQQDHSTENHHESHIAETAPETGPGSASMQADAPIPASADDLTILEGIGPKVAAVLAGIGVTTFKGLAEADLEKLRQTLDAAGYTYMQPSGWMEQAAFAARGDMDGLKKLQEELKGGRR